ncbi:hypothetical protein CXB51_004516 [Gossypium anomalum]|uniref:Aminotransferase-like plant mobile domain-containing protein n=1 Tax=Gossypium anomalum TaxID=47600 RepID=A0A8J5ZZK6_9ROSI|nr:hypothetical protein CXB51_004516 [Gossypium anomalum]
MGWLRDTFPKSGNDSTEVERILHARAYILEMIGGYLMLDLSRNLVHLRWLLKLIDFRATRELSWGSVVLAILYRETCRAMPPNKAKIGGCLSLLQSWQNHPASYVEIPTALEDIRLQLDQQSKMQNLKCSMTSTESTNGKRILIGQYSGLNISKFKKTDMIIYLIANRSSSQS